MQNYLSPEQFSAVWSRVAPNGSGGIIPKASPQQPEPEYEGDLTLTRCALLLRQMEGEDFLRRFLRSCSEAEVQPHLSDLNKRIRILSDHFYRATGRTYCLRHLLQLSWANHSLRNVAALSRRMEESYCRYGQISKDDRIRDSFPSFAQQHQKLQQMLLK